MKTKAKLNYVIDLIMGVSFIVTAITGIVLKIAFEEGVRKGGYQVFGGITKHGWVEIHDIAGMIMILTVILHFVLHWKWMVCMTKSFLKKKECEVKQENNETSS